MVCCGASVCVHAVGVVGRAVDALVDVVALGRRYGSKEVRVARRLWEACGEVWDASGGLWSGA